MADARATVPRDEPMTPDTIYVANIIWLSKFFSKVPTSNEVLYYEDIDDDEKYYLSSPLYYTVISEACPL